MKSDLEGCVGSVLENSEWTIAIDEVVRSRCHSCDSALLLPARSGKNESGDRAHVLVCRWVYR